MDAPIQMTFTVGQASRLLRVAPLTLSRWFDSGLLGGYLLPGRGRHRDRRIPRDELVRFLHRHGMPDLVDLEAWAASGETPAAFDRRIKAEEGRPIRASGASACSYCGKAFADHPARDPEPGGPPRRRLCNGDLVEIGGAT